MYLYNFELAELLILTKSINYLANVVITIMEWNQRNKWGNTLYAREKITKVIQFVFAGTCSQSDILISTINTFNLRPPICLYLKIFFY
jgi:hypothetical protein